MLRHLAPYGIVIGLIMFDGGSGVAHDLDDFTVMLFGVNGDLATREVAVKLAETLIATHYGSEALAGELPLRVLEDGDRWIVEGTRRGEVSVWQVEISKANAQVRVFQRTFQPRIPVE